MSWQTVVINTVGLVTLGVGLCVMVVGLLGVACGGITLACYGAGLLVLDAIIEHDTERKASK